MTDRATLLALAERVEAATGANAELDGDIMLALCPDLQDWRRPENAALRNTFTFTYGRLVVAPAYTSSLDAAATLVPDGRHVVLEIHPNGAAFVSLFRYSEAWIRSTSATPALALTAAALRARAEDADG